MDLFWIHIHFAFKVSYLESVMLLYADQARDILFGLAKARHVCVSGLDVNLQKFQGKLKKLQNLQVLPRRVVAKVGKVNLPDCPAAPSTVPHNRLQRIQNHKGGPTYIKGGTFKRQIFKNTYWGRHFDSENLDCLRIAVCNVSWVC